MAKRSGPKPKPVDYLASRNCLEVEREADRLWARWFGACARHDSSLATALMRQWRQLNGWKR